MVKDTPYRDNIYRMETDECAKYMAIAIVNKLAECWISPQPYLSVVYLAQYMPTFFSW